MKSRWCCLYIYIFLPKSGTW